MINNYRNGRRKHDENLGDCATRKSVLKTAKNAKVTINSCGLGPLPAPVKRRKDSTEPSWLYRVVCWLCVCWLCVGCVLVVC